MKGDSPNEFRAATLPTRAAKPEWDSVLTAAPIVAAR
jgi:hypothetical protein